MDVSLYLKFCLMETVKKPFFFKKFVKNCSLNDEIWLGQNPLNPGIKKIVIVVE